MSVSQTPGTTCPSWRRPRRSDSKPSQPRTTTQFPQWSNQRFDRCGNATTPRPRRKTLIANLFVLVTAIACLASYRMVRDALGRSPDHESGASGRVATKHRAPPAGPVVSDASDPGEVRTRVVVLDVRKGGTAKSVVAWGEPIGQQTREVLGTAEQAALLRELVRPRRCLIAAGDQLRGSRPATRCLNRASSMMARARPPSWRRCCGPASLGVWSSRRRKRNRNLAEARPGREPELFRYVAQSSDRWAYDALAECSGVGDGLRSLADDA